jgi:hypothetical protein
MNDDETHEGDDAALAALRQVADRATVHSVKETILACLLIRAVSHPRTRPRRVFISILTLSSMGLAGAHWHAWSILAHFIH